MNDPGEKKWVEIPAPETHDGNKQEVNVPEGGQRWASDIEL